MDLRSQDGDVNGNATKAIGLISKTTILHVHLSSLYISLESLYDFYVNPPYTILWRSCTRILLMRLSWRTRTYDNDIPFSF